MNIIVNGVKRPIKTIEVSYHDIVNLGIRNPTGLIVYTVLYRGGVPPYQQGSLTPGQSMPVQDGMIFTVADTGAA